MNNYERLVDFLEKTPCVTYTVWVDAGSSLHCKIGYTSNFFNRMKQLSGKFIGQPCYYCLLSADNPEEAKYRERIALDALRHYAVSAEWFSHREPYHLVRSWVWTFKLIECIAGADGKDPQLLLLPSDWDYYSRFPNLMGESIHEHTAVFETERMAFPFSLDQAGKDALWARVNFKLPYSDGRKAQVQP